MAESSGNHYTYRRDGSAKIEIGGDRDLAEQIAVAYEELLALTGELQRQLTDLQERIERVEDRIERGP